MLFAELALIRWLGSNVVHLSYFSNFVLLGSFLGVGVGFLLARREWSVVGWAPLLLLILVGIVFFRPVTIDRSGDEIVYFTSLQTEGPPAWAVLPVIFVLVALVVAGPSEVVGRCFARLPSLTAYRWDLVGSLTGIALFTLLSFLHAPSFVWGLLVAVAFAALLSDRKRLVATLCGAAMVGVLLVESTTPGVSWSPYYKVTTQDLTYQGNPVVDIRVNGVPHQQIWDAATRLRYEPQYGLPYSHLNENPLRRVLIVGAGSGTDVAIALSKGAQHVDAVDIDPRILQIGEQRNPNKPYDDPRVTEYTNDGRAFLSSTTNRYDLILFALPDSLALVNGASQIRLESFLFTEEALVSARDHLEPGGVFAMYNYYREDWLIDRLANTARVAFGHTPCVDQVGDGQAVVTVGLTPTDQLCVSDYTPAAAPLPPSTDDRPFLYFQGGMIPGTYLWLLLGIMLVTVIAVRALAGPVRSVQRYLDLFFMGAAFLLLETKNVATFALLFGTTWLVNALVFAGVIVVVLAAVEVTRRFRTPRQSVIFAGIGLSLLLAYVVRPEWLLPLPLVPRLVFAVVLGFLPIFLANVAFAKRFSAEGDSQTAFALNLVGAILGGCLEYAALLTGYRNLLVVVGLLYAAAFFVTPRVALRRS
jgi:SAM-dependent methyltransferase